MSPTYPKRELARRLLADEAGATAIEYALIGTLISIVIIGALTTIGGSLRTKFNAVAVNLQ
jgi:pilus assembly protein Flp/PilA